MVKRLGNFFLLIGLLCLALFFSSSAFLVDQAWFLLGGIGLTALGLLIKRRKKLTKKSRRVKRARNKDWEGDDESP